MGSLQGTHTALCPVLASSYSNIVPATPLWIPAADCSDTTSCLTLLLHAWQVLVDMDTPASVLEEVQKVVATHMEQNSGEFTCAKSVTFRETDTHPSK